MRKIQRADAELYQAVFTHRFCGRAEFTVQRAAANSVEFQLNSTFTLDD